MTFTYASEVIVSAHREVVFGFMALAWVFGSLYATGLAWWLLGSLKTSLSTFILSAAMFPLLSLIVCVLYLPESPHFHINAPSTAPDVAPNDAISVNTSVSIDADMDRRVAHCMDELRRISESAHRYRSTCCAPNTHTDTDTHTTLSLEQSHSLLDAVQASWTSNVLGLDPSVDVDDEVTHTHAPLLQTWSMRTKPLSTYLISLCFTFFFLSMASYGFSLWVPNLFNKLQNQDPDAEQDPIVAYQNTFIYSTAQLPACLVAMYAITRVSKTRLTVASNIVATIAMGLFTILFDSSIIVGLICICAYQMFTTAAWTAIVRFLSILF